MQWSQLLDSITTSTPWSREEARSAVVTTFSAVGHRLPRRLGEQLARELPPELARASLEDTESAAELSAEAVYEDVQRAALIGRARAMEQVQVVLAALAHHLSPETRERLLRELPADAAAWLTPRKLSEPPPRVGQGNTLAEGRPGSTVPLSESAPGSRHPVSSARPARAQQHAVSERNPHGDTKVSSSRGLTQEREHESLAEGRSKRP